jgi:hypothetical protein
MDIFLGPLELFGRKFGHLAAVPGFLFSNGSIADKIPDP